MNIDNIKTGEVYTVISAYGKPSQTVEITGTRESEVDLLYISEDVSKGMRTSFNRIEGERYLR